MFLFACLLCVCMREKDRQTERQSRETERETRGGARDFFFFPVPRVNFFVLSRCPGFSHVINACLSVRLKKIIVSASSKLSGREPILV